MEYKNLNFLAHQLMRRRSLKIVTQFLVSFSVFFLIYRSQYSSWCCFMLHSLKFYISSIPLQALDKRWIFLICNGILVVLANTSGFVSSPSSGFDLYDMIENKILGHAPEDTKDKWLAEPIENAVSDQVEQEEEIETDQDDQAQCFEEEQGAYFNLIEENHEEQEQGFCGSILKVEGRGESESEDEEIRTYYILKDDHQESEEDLEAAAGFLLAEQVQELEEEEGEEEEEEEHGMEKLSAEEWNKKFEDFIRKMKKEIRIEAQQQLVVVVK